jgi:hypothetical protein
MNNCQRDVVCCGITYKYRIEQTGENTCELIATPCPTPTATYHVATIRCRTNACANMDFYQAQINVDPCLCIQDCNLENIIERAICAYVNDLPTPNCRNNRNGLFNL